MKIISWNYSRENTSFATGCYTRWIQVISDYWRHGMPFAEVNTGKSLVITKGAGCFGLLSYTKERPLIQNGGAIGQKQLKVKFGLTMVRRRSGFCLMKKNAGKTMDGKPVDLPLVENHILKSTRIKFPKHTYSGLIAAGLVR